jgi:hypothetical protein
MPCSLIHDKHTWHHNPEDSTLHSHQCETSDLTDIINSLSSSIDNHEKITSLLFIVTKRTN